MSRIHWLVPAILACCSTVTAEPPNGISVTAEQMQRLGVTLEAVETSRWVTSDLLPANVTIPPRQESVVSAPSAGLLRQVRTVEGEEVASGEVLALLESPVLVTVQREYLQALTEKGLAEAEFRRDAQLHKEGIIAERRYLSTRARRDQADATLEERHQTLLLSGMDESAISRLAEDKKMSGTLDVKAPGGGVVLDVMAVIGQRVELSDPLFRIATLEPLWLQIRVPLERLAGVVPGTLVDLPCDGEQARVLHAHRYVDPDTQTVTVLAETIEGAQCLRPGQFVQVRLRQAGKGLRFRVPEAALVHSGQSQLVFVRTPSGFAAVPVEVIGRAEGHVVVSGELAETDRVAVSGLAAIKAAWLGLGGGEE